MLFSTRCSNLGMAATLAAATCGLTAQASTPDVVPAKSSELAVEQPAAARSPERLSPKVKAPIDRSGKKRVGKASFYAHMFAGRKMADGKQMDP